MREGGRWGKMEGKQKCVKNEGRKKDVHVEDGRQIQERCLFNTHTCTHARIHVRTCMCTRDMSKQHAHIPQMQNATA